MNTKLAAAIAVSVLSFTNLPAQDATVVADNLQYSREFYSGVHFQTTATLPRSFSYERYPDNGPERIRCDEDTFAQGYGAPRKSRQQRLKNSLI